MDNMEPVFLTPPMGRKKGYKMANGADKPTEAKKDTKVQMEKLTRNKDPIITLPVSSPDPKRKRNCILMTIWITITIILIVLIIWLATIPPSKSREEQPMCGQSVTSSTDNDHAARKSIITPSVESSSSNNSEVTTPSLSYSSNGTTANDEFSTSRTITIDDDEKKLFPSPADDVAAADVCWTLECKQLAAMTLSAMNLNQNPCTNFYEFACGVNKQLHVTQINKMEQDVKQRVANALHKIDDHSPPSWQILKGFYSQCHLHNNQIKTKSKLNQIRSEVDTIGIDKDLTLLLSKMILRHSTPIFDVDRIDGGFQLTPPHRRSLLVTQSVTHDSTSFIEEALNELDLFNDQQQLVDQSLAILSLLRQWLPPKDKLKQEYTIMNISQLMEKWKVIDWKTLFKQLSGADVSLDDSVRIYMPNKYMDKVFKMLTTENQTSVRNALQSFYAGQLYGELMIPIDCHTTTANLMQDNYDNIYLATFPDEYREKIKNKANDMFSYLQSTLDELSEWPENQQLRDEVKNKINSMRLNVNKFTMSSPDALEWNDFRLEDNYTKSALILVQRYRKSMYENKVNGDRNEVVIPFAMAHNYYDDHHPVYWNMGNLGYLIARQMMHHFDQTGIIAYGLERMNTSREYSQVMDRIRQKVSSSFITLADQTQFAVDELYAEEEGIKLAWETYVRRHHNLLSAESDDEHLLPWLNMTDAQLFFLASAQIHCGATATTNGDLLPGWLRVSGLVSNSIAFKNAYHCQTVTEPVVTSTETVVEEGDSSWLDDVKAQLARKALTTTTVTEMSVTSITEAEDDEGEEEDSTEKD